jgi:hypothetical protein
MAGAGIDNNEVTRIAKMVTSCVFPRSRHSDSLRMPE